MNLRKTVQELDQKYHDRKVVLVDNNDNEVGIAGLIEAHRELGLQHRAFSLQLYRKVGDKTELLLQQRAQEKPVFPFYWANTCCYNMAPGESYLPRAVSRLGEEMGAQIDTKILRIIYKFSYYAPDVEGWCENELDTVIVGEWEGPLNLNPEEAMAYKWIAWDELKADIQDNADIYAPWFRQIISDSRFQAVFE